MPTPYTQLLSGTQEVVSTLACFASAGEIKARTPLMQNGTGLMVEWDGTPGKAVYLTISEINTATKTRAQVYKCGIFNIDEINWPDTADTFEKKISAFVGSGISVQPLGG
ncbi:head decoration protein [Escherichia coli]|uniref:head decoration protein n=1 Tax=Escherichia coli TaxID=562 RepID=UPI000B7DA0C2|nr:head decoration protein [Escherichia coli]EEZ4278546.1 head decoration protein [Escherichia coli]EIB9637128.1 head decoration protein [Escherichia coli]EJF1648010.1 head decoration protein [Escherichia coli]EJF3477759.1 head decoration protein [Escherichia coli]EJF3500064.1 head decoration protein [Escherichia coli]